MGEYIEREAALSAVDCGNLHKGIVDALQENIKDIPAADVVEVRHGRWISDSPGKRFGTVVRLDKDGCPVGSCHCSECGEWLTASDEYPVIGYYCPNCGAKMTEDRHEQKE